MNKQQTNKIIIAWLLSVILLVPGIVKATHIYQNEYGCESCCHSGEENEHEPHDCNSCVLCQFHFHSFIETAPIQIDVVLTGLYKPFFIHYPCAGYQTTLQSCYLRGPPMV